MRRDDDFVEAIRLGESPADLCPSRFEILRVCHDPSLVRVMPHGGGERGMGPPMTRGCHGFLGGSDRMVGSQMASLTAGGGSYGAGARCRGS